MDPDPAVVVPWAPIAVVLAGAILYTILGGIFTVTVGLIVVALFLGWLCGRLVSPPARAAVVAAIAILAGLLGIWLFGRIEGGVLDPIAYFDDVQGWPARRRPARRGMRDGRCGIAMTTTGAELRHATEEDQPRIAALVDHWFAGRPVAPLVGRTWFRHFSDTSFLLESSDGAPVGFLLGFLSPARPDEAVLHLLAVDPNRRRAGLGSRLLDAFVERAGAGGARSVRAVAWPDDRGAIEFLRANGFRTIDGPGSQNLYGVPAWPDHEAIGEDRAILVRVVDAER